MLADIAMHRIAWDSFSRYVSQFTSTLTFSFQVLTNGKNSYCLPFPLGALFPS